MYRKEIFVTNVSTNDCFQTLNALKFKVLSRHPNLLIKSRGKSRYSFCEHEISFYKRIKLALPLNNETPRYHIPSIF